MAFFKTNATRSCSCLRKIWFIIKKELTEEDTGAIIVKLTARHDMFLQRATRFWKIFQNKIKKLLTNRTTHDKISELPRLRQWTDRTKPIEKNFQKMKKVLDKTDLIRYNKQAVARTTQRTLITEQWNNLERFNEFQGVVNNNTRTFLYKETTLKQ